MEGIRIPALVGNIVTKIVKIFGMSDFKRYISHSWYFM